MPSIVLITCNYDKHRAQNIARFHLKTQRSAVTLVARYTDSKAAYPGPYSLRTDRV
jgi:hypothetical protein